MKHMDSEITINATPEEVWAELIDLDSYQEWNPYIVKAVGTATEGSRLAVTLSPPGSRGTTLKPTVTELRSGEVLEWWGHVGFRGIFDGRHRFEVHPDASGTRLTQSETFTGVLVPFMARSLDRGTAAGFTVMNEALKARAEQRHAANNMS
jgi:hypothetical protein